jgi:hypothetical protein
MMYLKVRLWLFFKVFFIYKCIKIIFFFIFKKLFLISAHQNNLKILKKFNLKQIKKLKKNLLNIKINRAETYWVNRNF